jgi:hypothetical protein
MDLKRQLFVPPPHGQTSRVDTRTSLSAAYVIWVPALAKDTSGFDMSGGNWTQSRMYGRFGQGFVGCSPRHSFRWILDLSSCKTESKKDKVSPPVTPGDHSSDGPSPLTPVPGESGRIGLVALLSESCVTGRIVAPLKSGELAQPRFELV